MLATFCLFVCLRFPQAQHAKDLGISDKGFSRLYLFLRLAETFARPIGGVLCGLKKVKVLCVLLLATLVLGVLFLLLPILRSNELMVLFAVLYGLAGGVRTTAMSITILTCFENPVKKASGYGIAMMASSLALGAGPPVAG